MLRQAVELASMSPIEVCVRVCAYGVCCLCVQLGGGIGSIFVDLGAPTHVGAQSGSPVCE